MERGFESLGAARRPTVIGLIEDRLKEVQLAKVRSIEEIPPHKLTESDGYSDIQIFDRRIDFLTETLQLLRMYDGAISANRRAIDYFSAAIDQLKSTASEYEQLADPVSNSGDMAIVGDITAILQSYKA